MASAKMTVWGDPNTVFKISENFFRGQSLGFLVDGLSTSVPDALKDAAADLGEALDVAMEPVATYSGEPTILALVNFGSGLALIGSDGRSGAMVPRNRRFVFALPARDRLEARRDGEPVIP